MENGSYPKKGLYKLAFNGGDGKPAHFAEILIHVEEGGPREGIDFYGAERHWHGSVRFGLEYAWEQIRYRQGMPARLHIFVERLTYMEVDTAPATVAFVSAMALFDACGVRPRVEPSLDLENGIYLFPK